MLNKINILFADRREHRSERVTLKPQTSDDIDIYLKLWSNPEVTKLIAVMQNKSEEEMKKTFATMLGYFEKEFMFRYTIWHNETNSKIGSFGVNAINRVSSRVDIGFLLLPEYWNQGIISEIIEMMLKYLFGEIRLNKVCANTAEDNIACWKLLEKSGFRQEGILKEHNYRENEDKFYDDIRYGILRKEWEKGNNN
jgi:ribosomal-protein-alanine N-acetyltransferase